MKVIPINELIAMIESIGNGSTKTKIDGCLTEKEIKHLFKRYGDDYFLEQGSCRPWELCEENQARKEWFDLSEGKNENDY